MNTAAWHCMARPSGSALIRRAALPVNERPVKVPTKLHMWANLSATEMHGRRQILVFGFAKQVC